MRLLPVRTTTALARRCDRRLRALARHAAHASPYYAGLFARNGVNVRDIRSAEDLARLPVLDKATARAGAADIVIRGTDLSTCRTRHSNGTTGTPFHMPVSPADDFTDAWLWTAGYLTHGHPLFGLQAKIGRAVVSPMGRSPLTQWGPLRRRHLSADAEPEAKVAALARLRPASLVCWASVLDEISFWLEQGNTALHIPLVFSTSDVLTPQVRQRAQERLNARVVDVYGAVETGPIAWECAHGGGYHVHMDLTTVELLDDANRPAPSGRVVCTVLWRRSFPLIRYDLGDLAEWDPEPCPCGSPYPRLRRLHGREEDLIRLPNGSHINSERLRTMIFEAPGVRQYQLIQQAPTSFFARVVAGPEFDAAAERKVLAEFERSFGGVLTLAIRRTDRIPRMPEVKFTPMVTLERLERMRAAGRDTRVFFES